MSREMKDIAKRRAHVLTEARETWNRLKRRRLAQAVQIWPDESHRIVGVLAVFAYDIHAYLTRAEKRQQRRAGEERS